MREIKFKAKIVSDGEWVEGSFIYPNEIVPNLSTCDDTDAGIPIIIDPRTICQFTGLCDRNGKEIYEGDIVKHKSSSYENPLEVEWICDYACVGFVDKTDFNTPYFMQKIDEPKLIVIGNIHDK